MRSLDEVLAIVMGYIGLIALIGYAYSKGDKGKNTFVSRGTNILLAVIIVLGCIIIFL